MKKSSDLVIAIRRLLRRNACAYRLDTTEFDVWLRWFCAEMKRRGCRDSLIIEIAVEFGEWIMTCPFLIENKYPLEITKLAKAHAHWRVGLTDDLIKQYSEND